VRTNAKGWELARTCTSTRQPTAKPCHDRNPRPQLSSVQALQHECAVRVSARALSSGRPREGGRVHAWGEGTNWSRGLGVHELVETGAVTSGLLVWSHTALWATRSSPLNRLETEHSEPRSCRFWSLSGRRTKRCVWLGQIWRLIRQHNMPICRYFYGSDGGRSRTLNTAASRSGCSSAPVVTAATAES